MKKAPSLIHADEISSVRSGSSLVFINGKWVHARPIGHFSLANRIQLAWMVFTGKADALVWPEDQ